MTVIHLSSEPTDGWTPGTIYRPYRIACTILASLTASIALLTLTGWAFGLPLLTSLSPGYAPMKVTTAIGMLCSAAAILLKLKTVTTADRSRFRVQHTFALLFAGVAGLLGFGTLTGYALGLQGDMTHPGWMAPATGGCFVMLALALQTIHLDPPWRWISESLTLGVLFIGTLGLIGYLYDEQSLYALKPYVSMALHTALSFVFLAMALLCAKPDRGMMATITTAEPGGFLIRRMVPLTVGMVILIGWIHLIAKKVGWVDSNFGMALVAGLSVGGFSAILWSIARALNRAVVARSASEERFPTLADNMSQFAWIADAGGCLTWYNKRWFDYTGTTLGEMQGWGWKQVHHPDHVDRVVARWKQAHATGEPWEDTFPLRGKDGHYRWFLSRAMPIHDANGKIVQWFGTNTDVTDQRVAEESLRRLKDDLEVRVQQRTQDLRQSQVRLRALTSELNLAEQRERKRLATELHDYLQQLLVYGKLTIGQGKRRVADASAAADVMKKVDEVLSEALTYTRTLVAELSPPVLRDHGLAAGLKWLAEYMKKHEQTVRVTVPEGEGPQLPDDQVMLLFQSVRELLINALKHAETGEVTVTMEQLNENLSITVSDKGKGFNLAAAESPSGGISSKFGLISIDERMRALGGSFNIQSAPGEGTTVTLVLPLATIPRDRVLNPPVSGSLDVGAALSAHPSDSTTKGQMIIQVLLVDDHAMMRQGLRAVLDTYEDIQVVGEAQDGAEAVKLVRELRPRVVVMDINMPTMNGIEATTSIKTHWPETIVVGISVNAQEDNGDAMKRAGAATVLTKDNAVGQLRDAIVQEVGLSVG